MLNRTGLWKLSSDALSRYQHPSGFQVPSLLVTIRENDQNFYLFTGLNIGARSFVKPDVNDPYPPGLRHFHCNKSHIFVVNIQ